MRMLHQKRGLLTASTAVVLCLGLWGANSARATTSNSGFTVVTTFSGTPSAVAFDAQQNLYVAFDNGPRDLGTTSILEYLLGNPQNSITYQNDGGKNSALTFNAASGQLVEVRPTNIASSTVFSVNSNSASALGSIDNATGVTADLSGNIFVSTGVDGTIVKIASDSSETTLVRGLANPTSLLAAPNGILYVGDCGAGSSNGQVIRLTISSQAREVVSRGLICPGGFAIGPNGALFASDFVTGTLYRQTTLGAFAPVVRGLHHPEGLAFDNAGNLYVANSGAKQLIQVPVTNIASELQIKHQKALTTSKSAKVSWTGSGFSTSTTCKLYRKSGARLVKVGTRTVEAQNCSFAHLAKNSKYAVGVVATDGTLTGPTSWISFKTKVK